MNYLNIHTDTLKSDAFIGAEPTERATWLCLLGWSVTQENGGTILNCKDWSDRKWQQLCGVTKEEVHADSELFNFSGQNLRIAYYPKAQEDEVIKKRVTAKANGKLGGRPKKKETNVGTNVGFENKPTLESKNANQLTNVQNRKVKERNGMKRNEKEYPLTPKGECGDESQIPKLEDVIEAISPKLYDLNSEWTPERARKAISLKYETCIAQGWKDGHGNKITNWKLKFVNMLKFEKPWNYGTNDKPASSGNEKILKLADL